MQVNQIQTRRAQVFNDRSLVEKSGSIPLCLVQIKTLEGFDSLAYPQPKMGMT